MIVASGRSSRHVGALADYVQDRLRQNGTRSTIEGAQTCDWVLLDAGDIIVHLFRPEVRVYYNLEKMWGPAIEIGTQTPNGDAGMIDAGPIDTE